MPISSVPPDFNAGFNADVSEPPASFVSVLRLAQSMRQQGQFVAACEFVQQFLRKKKLERHEFQQALMFLEQSGRSDLAFDCVESRLAEGVPVPEDFADSARLAVQLGRFDLARDRYRSALQAGVDPYRSKVAQGLAMCQRYTHDDHPDLALFASWLQQAGLDHVARASVLYALGKAHDDLGHYRDAADCWRQANTAMAMRQRWSAQAWQQAITLTNGPWASVQDLSTDSTPLFVIGMPRSGTTLVARLLAACPEVCDRGELMWIPQLFEQIVHSGGGLNPELMQEAATGYWRMVVQDDQPARWYIDKQPLNFLHLGLIAALFPRAQVVYCVRDPRDVALSIWTQCFVGQSSVFTHRFSDIATVLESSRVRMSHWKQHLSLPIHTVAYERLVEAPEETIVDLYGRLGLPAPRSGIVQAAHSARAAVATASMWQVRQPITTRSVGRWRHYASFVPELVSLFETATDA